MDLSSPASITVISGGPAEAAVQIEYLFGESRAVQTLRLAADSEALVVETEVDWHEHERLLKLSFPIDVHADQSISEIQFGHLQRPTHTNTSWDNARFEFVAHRFVYVGETGYGVAIVNDGIYGHEVGAIARSGGGRATLARLSILRSANFPDPRGENGSHHFRYAIVPGATVADAVRHGYNLNLPPRTAMAERVAEPLVVFGNQAVVVEAVKAADDRSGDVIVRCYESLGGQATTTLRTSFPLRQALVTDLLERRLAEVAVEAGSQLTLHLRPFQVLTLRLSPGK
jgi:alpha-mannosidase